MSLFPGTEGRKTQARAWLSLVLVACLGLGGCGAPAKLGPDLRQEAVDLNEAGYEAYRESRLKLAREKFAQALRLNRLIDHRAGMVANLDNLGVVALEQGDLTAARKSFEEAVSLARELGAPEVQAEALNNLGTAFEAQGNWGRAEELYQEALEWARLAPKGGPMVSLSLTHLGDAARHRGDFTGALALYQEALEIDRERRDRRGQAVRWERLGRTYLAMGDYNLAASYLHQALASFRQEQATGGIIDALDGLTRLALARGDRTEARMQGARLMKIYQDRGQKSEAEKLGTLLKGSQGK